MSQEPPKFNLPLAYTEAGEGMPVVLIHGFCESRELWRDFVGPLSQHFRIIALDLPGFGANAPLTTPVTIGDLAEAVYHFLITIGVEHPVMIGHSLGGYVALAFAEKFPQRLRGLGLFHSTAQNDSFEKKQARNKTIEFIERYGLEEFVDQFFTPLFFDGRRKDLKDEIKFLTDIGKATSKETVMEVIKAMRDRKDRSRVLEKLTCPVLMIAGKNDTAIPFTNSMLQFGLPYESMIQVLSNTGHMGMLERPKETLLMVKNFLDYVNSFD
jgi:pimeloyl-ACP methyl ester carboxylesterase